MLTNALQLHHMMYAHVFFTGIGKQCHLHMRRSYFCNHTLSDCKNNLIPWTETHSMAHCLLNSINSPPLSETSNAI